MLDKGFNLCIIIEATKRQKISQKECGNERDGPRREEHENWNHKQKEKILKENLIKDGRKKWKKNWKDLVS